jgi:beta-exotoxin I transport system permease protein
VTALVLLGHHWRRHRAALLLLGCGLAAFEFVITRIAPTPAEAGFIRNLFGVIPGPARELLQQQIGSALSGRGFLAFGWVHPVTLLMLGIWAVRVPSGALAREIGQGTMDLVASRPVTRASQVGAALAALLIGLTILAAAGWTGTALGIATRAGLETAARDYVVSAAMTALLFAAFGAVALAVSAAVRESGVAIAIMAGLITVSFALDYLARAWQPIHALRVLSLFRYDEPQRILASGPSAIDLAVLGGVLVVATASAFIIFSRRDL